MKKKHPVLHIIVEVNVNVSVIVSVQHAIADRERYDPSKCHLDAPDGSPLPSHLLDDPSRSH